MRQKRKAQVPNGGYSGSKPMQMPEQKPKHRPRAWMTSMKDLK